MFDEPLSLKGLKFLYSSIKDFLISESCVYVQATLSSPLPTFSIINTLTMQELYFPAAIFFLHLVASVDATSNRGPKIYLQIISSNVGRIQRFIRWVPEALSPVGKSAGP
jgi:hypothetical protein